MLARLKSAVRVFATWEPAQWRALWVALAAVAASLGFGQWVADLDPKVQAFISAASLLLPIVQGLWTRRAVSPVIRVKALEKALNAATAARGGAQAPQVPGTVGVDQPHPYQP